MEDQLRLYFCTWNVGAVDPPEDLTQLLKLDQAKLPELYAVAIQELPSSPKNLVVDAIFDDPWTLKLTDVLGAKDFVKVDSIRLMGIHLAVFIKRSLIRYVSGVEHTWTPTGFNGYWGNKGAVSTRLNIKGVSLCIVNCHMAPHLPKVQERIQNYGAIVEGQKFNHPDTSNILEHDYVFWIGDLNFRLDDVSHEEVIDHIKRGDLEPLKKYDQLNKLIKEEVIFLNFRESPIKFNPTYKFDYGTDDYDTSKKKRKPGWCDRILWQVQKTSIDNESLLVKPLHYTSHPEYKESDHKGVSASFDIKVSPHPREAQVIFDDIGNWNNNVDGLFAYVVSSELQVDKWDWIGLVKADFKHFKDYVTWAWAPFLEPMAKKANGTRYKVTIHKAYLVGHSGPHMLFYYSELRKSIVAFSDVFEIES